MSYTDFGGLPQANVHMGANGVGTVTYGSDEKLHVVFYDRPVLDAVRSKQEGRPYHNLVPFVTIQEPGEFANLNIIDRPATVQDRARFPNHFAKYEQGKGTEQPGTPVSILFPYNPDIVASLIAMKLSTVELLAKTEATGGMGVLDWKKKAQQYLEIASNNAANAKLQSDLDQRDQRILGLEAQIAEIRSQMAVNQNAGLPITANVYAGPAPLQGPMALPAEPAPRRRGRPPSQPFGTGD